MDIFFQKWPDIFQIAGAILAIVGTFLMANRYLNIRLYQIPRQMILSLVGRGTVLSQVATWTKEDNLKTIRGLTLIAIGFVLQMATNCYSLWMFIFHK